MPENVGVPTTTCPQPSRQNRKKIKSKTKHGGIFPLTQDMEEPSFPTSDDYLETPKQLHYFYGADGALRWLPLSVSQFGCLAAWQFGCLPLWPFVWPGANLFV